jgi:hypothetical protein
MPRAAIGIRYSGLQSRVIRRQPDVSGNLWPTSLVPKMKPLKEPVNVGNKLSLTHHHCTRLRIILRVSLDQ